MTTIDSRPAEMHVALEHANAIPSPREIPAHAGQSVPTAPTLTIIVPTRHESANIDCLVTRLQAAVSGLDAELLFVDDSDDATPDVIREAAHRAALPVRLIHREPGSRSGGLGTAVVEGLRAAHGQWALVMDGDLQHPPEVVRNMLTVARRRSNDLVIASRYAGSGSSDGLGGRGRRSASKLATGLAKMIFPRRVGRLTDPMSGFFLVRLAALNLGNLRPVGYKILLEIVVRQPRLRIAEVAFTFADRNAGQSKASIRELLRFARHLARLRLQVAAQRDCVASDSPRLRSRRFATFAAVGASGLGVNALALWGLQNNPLTDMHYVIDAAVATQVSTLWNFVLANRFVFPSATASRRWARLLAFAAMNNVALLCRLPLLVVLVHAGTGVLTANALTLILFMIIRYRISDRLIFTSTSAATGAETPDAAITAPGGPVNILLDLVANPAQLDRPRPKRIRYLPYRYDIGGIVTVGSQVELPELTYFRAQWIDTEVDIALRVGDVGHGTKARASMTQFTQAAAIRYEEHLGRLGANFRIDIGDRIDVTVGPLLAKSPHVVYTNVMEALLRFVLASRGRMLLHSACIELDGKGIMMSARTDTGKTGTILRLLRERGGRFLSDDMTIIDSHARALAFPKPLTISHHTLRAVEARDLTPHEWRVLKLQSRLHSKEGRGLALVLARANVPIMAINSMTQRLVPPPKYNVDRLVPCRIGGSTTVEEMFFLERGAPGIWDMTRAAAVDELMVNTADAYNFPPFQYFASSIVLGGADFDALLDAERALLCSAMASVRARRIASDAFTWADDIPRLLGEDAVDAHPSAPTEEPDRHAAGL